MELYVVAILVLAGVILALWLLAKRIRTWKEQILHAVSIVESNNAIAHQATRQELSQQLTSVSAIAHDATRRELSEQLTSVEQRHTLALDATSEQLRNWSQVQASLQRLTAITSNVEAELAVVQNEVGELSQQTNLRRLARVYGSEPRFMADCHPHSARFDEAVAFLRSLDGATDNAEAAASYLDVHLRRLARTIDITPPPESTRRALELGAYMHITPALACLLGYNEVRGGYLGPADRNPVRKTASIGHKTVFTCDIDFFDAERDRFPYPDGHFDVVLACEILEHLRLDPMHMLLESGRVLAPNGALVLTTPNVGSFTSLARAMSGVNPQIWSRYPVSDAEIPHVREYTPAEVHDLLVDAGFTVECLFTEPIDSRNAEAWIGPLLDHLGFPKNLRGEQTYVLARKRLGAKVIRRPEFLYE
jgi:SAM-dependent methyltransferase